MYSPKRSKQCGIAYFVATEQLAFKNTPKLVSLKVGTEVSWVCLRETSLLAENYLIAESCRQQLNTMVSNAYFFLIAYG